LPYFFTPGIDEDQDLEPDLDLEKDHEPDSGGAPVQDLFLKLDLDVSSDLVPEDAPGKDLDPDSEMRKHL